MVEFDEISSIFSLKTRSKRFSDHFLAYFLGVIRVTGLRYVYDINKIVYEWIGDEQTEERQALLKKIAATEEKTLKLGEKLLFVSFQPLIARPFLHWSKCFLVAILFVATFVMYFLVCKPV